jgi:hypothetical protein
MKSLLYQNNLGDPKGLVLRDPSAEVTDWQGRKALTLNGLAVIPDLSLPAGHIEVRIGADGATYAGIAFRLLDVWNYELAYAQPHTSGGWDAIQYDSVFHGSATWQLLPGPAFQYFPTSAGEVELSRWIDTSKEDLVNLEFGFSDRIKLMIDGESLYQGENLFKSTTSWEDRGYVEPLERATFQLSPGRHRLTAALSASEPFGWGLLLKINASYSQLLPAYLG